MINIICIAIIAEKKIGNLPHAQSVLGKRKLIECGLAMRFTETPLLFVCAAGHRRIWPPQEQQRRKVGLFKNDL